MPQPTHPPTLYLSALPKQALVGIDLLSLTASTRFKGFTALPPGWHFLFVGANQSFSTRQGAWFHITSPDGPDRAAHAGQKRQRADSQPLGVRGELLTETSVVHSPTAAWLALLEWDEQEQLRPVEDHDRLEAWRQKLLDGPESQQLGLFPYRQAVLPSDRIVDDDGRLPSADGAPGSGSSQDFSSLCGHVSEHLLERLCGPDHAGFWMLDTASSTRADAEAERIPGLSMDEQTLGRPLGLLDINLKVTWRPDAVGRQRTEAARDRSWRLAEIVASSTQNFGEERPDETMTDPASDATTLAQVRSGEMLDDEWGSEVLGEFEFCFLIILCLANWSCLSQWRRILETCLTCESIVLQRPVFFAAFLSVLETQLRHTNLVEGGLFDVEADGGDFLKRQLRRFGNTLSNLAADGDQAAPSLDTVNAAFKGVKDAVRDIWGWEFDGAVVKRGMVQLEDGEMVELETQEHDDDDETGEYAPVVVET